MSIKFYSSTGYEDERPWSLQWKRGPCCINSPCITRLTLRKFPCVLLTEDQINNRKHNQELQGDFMPPKLFFSVTLVYINHLGWWLSTKKILSPSPRDTVNNWTHCLVLAILLKSRLWSKYKWYPSAYKCVFSYLFMMAIGLQCFRETLTSFSL